MADHIRDQFSSYIGKTAFEELARQQVQAWGDAGELPFTPQHVGRAGNRQAEIDVVAINWKDRAVLFGECKWTSRKMAERDLASLKERAAKLTKLAGFNVHYALFSKSGFTAGLSKAAQDSVILVQGGDFKRLR